MADSLGMKVSKLVLQDEPKLLACDIEATVRATAALAKVMGCLLATILTKEGETAYLECIRCLMLTVNENAGKTANKAIEISMLRDKEAWH